LHKFLHTHQYESFCWIFFFLQLPHTHQYEVFAGFFFLLFNGVSCILACELSSARFGALSNNILPLRNAHSA